MNCSEFLIEKPKAPDWTGIITTVNGTRISLLVSSNVKHEDYIEVNRYLIVIRYGNEFKTYELNWTTEQNSSIEYLAANTHALGYVPIELNDHDSNFSVIVEYSAGGMLKNISSNEAPFDFFTTFPSM